jgi:ABC-type glutathione transport system ATPase component
MNNGAIESSAVNNGVIENSAMNKSAHESSAMSDLILQCRGLSKSYFQGKLEVAVLAGVDLEVRKGESAAIVGASGSGKSTLLHLLGGLDAPTGGSVELLGRDPFSLSEAERCTLRNAALGLPVSSPVAGIHRSRECRHASAGASAGQA